MHGSVELTPDLVLSAYAQGWFPMAERREDTELFWLSPEERGVIPLDKFHVPRRLARLVRSDHYEVRYDTAFAEVIRACAAPAPDRSESWINADILRLYEGLFEMGHAHSVECWHDGKLAGGLYGVSLRGAFFGESMFSRERDASKVALVHLVARLIEGGFSLLDAQFITTHLSQFGAIAISRPHYLRWLEKALMQDGKFYCPASSGSATGASSGAASGDLGLTGVADAIGADSSPGRSVLQLITHTS